MKTKSQIMSSILRGLVHEVFVHETEGRFDITLMREAAKHGCYGDPEETELDTRLLETLKQTRDWDVGRVRELLNEQSKPWDDPVLVILYPDNEFLLCDGTHRLLARFELKLPNFRYYPVPVAQAIRPSDQWVYIPSLDWGKIEIRDGKLYHRGTGELLKS